MVKIKANIKAIFADNNFAAIGRYFFNGCNRSAFASITSLKTYTADDNKQKHTRACTDLTQIKISGLKLKSGAVNTNRFFVQCLGLLAFKSRFDIGIIECIFG
tara:strand:+ start:282 stop:590 length:309 start_codon:yes stop_codon:yes gene_type:complete